MAFPFDTTSGSGGISNLTGDPPPPFLTGGFDPTITNANRWNPFLRSIPGYQFAFDQNLRGIQSNAAASGTLLTGGTLKKIARGESGLADQHYGDTINRYLSLADLGLRGATAPFI